MSDYIKRDRLSDIIETTPFDCYDDYLRIKEEVGYIPSADVVEYEIADNTTMIIKSDKWENIGRVILTNYDTKFCKVLYVDDERKRGEWIENGYTSCGATVYECSVCKCEIDEMPTGIFGDYGYVYCPYCGADMRERKGE